MNLFRAEDERIVNLLIRNGYICKKPQSKSNASIQVHLQTEKEFQESKWYETDCPFELNNLYRLPDGTLIQSSGTSLLILES